MADDAPISFLPAAREILGAPGARRIEPAKVLQVLNTPQHRFLSAVTTLEGQGIAAAAAARRIYCRSSLTDEIALPDVEAAGSILRLLAHEEGAGDALSALADMLAPLSPEAA